MRRAGVIRPLHARMARRLAIFLLLPAWLAGCAAVTDASVRPPVDTMYEAVLLSHGLDEGARLSAALGLRLDAHALDIQRLEAAGFSTGDLRSRVRAMSEEMHRREAALDAELQVLMQETTRLAAHDAAARAVAGETVRGRLLAENRHALSPRVDTVLAAARELERTSFGEGGYAAAAALFDTGYERRRQWLQRFTISCRESDEEKMGC